MNTYTFLFSDKNDPRLKEEISISTDDIQDAFFKAFNLMQERNEDTGSTWVARKSPLVIWQVIEDNTCDFQREISAEIYYSKEEAQKRIAQRIEWYKDSANFNIEIDEIEPDNVELWNEDDYLQDHISLRIEKKILE